MNALERHNVRQTGSGTPLLFSHGYGCDQNVWRDVAPGFADSHRVLLMDHAGCGGSAPGAYSFERHATLQGHADDIVAVCEAAGLQDTVLVAHSVSTMSSMLAAQARPDLFAALVMLAPSPCYLNEAGYAGGFEREDIDSLLELLDANHFKWARMMAPVVMGNPDRPGLAGGLADSFCRMAPDAAKHFAQTTFLSDLRGQLSGLRVPTLIVQCRDDALAPPAVGDYLQRRWPHARLTRLQATGHCPHMSAPCETAAVIRTFLSTLPNGQQMADGLASPA
jgi:sigma-B regulation protein RsbQ